MPPSADRRSPTATEPGELARTVPAHLETPDELAVLQAVAWAGVEQQLTAGVSQRALRAQLHPSVKLGRHLRRLHRCGALRRSGRLARRRWSLTPCGLITLLRGADAAHVSGQEG